MSSEWQTFLRRLAAIRNRRRLGLFGGGLLRVASCALLALGALVLFDRFAAMSDPLRWGCALAWSGALLGGTVWTLARALRFSLRDAARLADESLHQRRKPVLTALELGSVPPRSDNEFSAYLLQRSVQAGEGTVSTLPRAAVWPRALLRRAGLALLAAMGVLGGILALQGRDAPILLARVLLPHRDFPPVSPYRFTVLPAAPAVIYGETISLAVQIDGAPVRQQVWLRTRANGVVHQASCFQESPTRYVQKLENVQQSVDICFGTGRARSRWQPVALLLQPRILTARATLTPPAYTGSHRREFFVGNEPFAALAGTVAEVVLTSNRPLLDGSVEIRPRARPEDARVAAAKIVAPDRAAFTWTLDEPAEIRLTLRDLQGTPSAAPLVVDQKILPDQPPEITISTPPPFALATPDATLPFQARITDDYGLRRLDWVRALSGYRERFLPIGVPPAARQAEFRRDLDLRLLGCVPGQELEFYMEAVDNNPRTPGFAASPIVRVQIISTEEYAAMVRTRVLLEEFEARFAEADRRMEALRQALETVAKAAPADREAARRDAVEAIMDAEELFARLADDFAAYDLEEDLRDAALEATRKIVTAHAALADAEDPAAMAADLLAALGPSSRRMSELREQADDVVKAGAVMEQASIFMQILDRQRELKLALSRYLDPTLAHDPALLQLLGERQADILAQLRQWQTNVVEATKGLPPELQELADDAIAFANDVAQCGAYDAMRQCTDSATNRQGEDAHRWASLALERLEALLKKSCEGGNCMGGMCKGMFSLTGAGDLAETLKQMLDAMCRRSGIGQGKGTGSGPGQGMGIGEGTAASGHSPLNVPVLGPPRGVFAPASTARGAGRGSGQPGTGASVEPGAHSAVSPARRDTVSTLSTTLDQVPEKYRDAVRRYFSEEKR